VHSKPSTRYIQRLFLSNHQLQNALLEVSVWWQYFGIRAETCSMTHSNVVFIRQGYLKTDHFQVMMYMFNIIWFIFRTFYLILLTLDLQFLNFSLVQQKLLFEQLPKRIPNKWYIIGKLIYWALWVKKKVGLASSWGHPLIRNWNNTNITKTKVYLEPILEKFRSVSCNKAFHWGMESLLGQFA